MGLFDFFDNDASGRDQVYNVDPDNEDHKSSFSHELLGGAAAFEAMRKYEQHQEENGKPQSHKMAKEIAAGFAAAEVDKLFETKGLDAFDREKAKYEAKQRVEQAIDQSGEY